MQVNDVVIEDASEEHKSMQRTCIELAGTLTGVMLALIVVRPLFYRFDPWFDTLMRVVGRLL